MQSANHDVKINPAVVSGSDVGPRIVTEARSWLGTPFEHQGRIKGKGVDCANMVAMTLMATLPQYAERVKAFANNYRRKEDGTLLKQILNDETEFIPTEERRPGDILALIDEALHDREIPRHLVFVESVTSATTFVVDPTERGVRRHRLNLYWISRIHSCWRVIA